MLGEVRLLVTSICKVFLNDDFYLEQRNITNHGVT